MVPPGGRYDGLLKALWPPLGGAPMGAVGVTLNVERLIGLAAPPKQRERPPSLQASQARSSCCLHPRRNAPIHSYTSVLLALAVSCSVLISGQLAQVSILPFAISCCMAHCRHAELPVCW